MSSDLGTVIIDSYGTAIGTVHITGNLQCDRLESKTPSEIRKASGLK